MLRDIGRLQTGSVKILKVILTEVCNPGKRAIKTIVKAVQDKPSCDYQY
jgi:hypothetical protein